MWLFVVQGAVLGVSVAIAPGPLQAYLLAQTMRHGPRHTLPLILAPVVSDVPIIAVVVFTLTWLPSWALSLLEVVGGLVLIYLAYDHYRSMQRHDPAAPPLKVRTGENFIKAVLLNALSPGPYIFWSTIAGPLFLHGWSQDPWLGWVFLAAFGVGLVGGLAAYVLASGSARSLDARYAPIINIGTVIILAGFGLYQLYNGLLGSAAVVFAR